MVLDNKSQYFMMGNLYIYLSIFVAVVKFQVSKDKSRHDVGYTGAYDQDCDKEPEVHYGKCI